MGCLVASLEPKFQWTSVSIANEHCNDKCNAQCNACSESEISPCIASCVYIDMQLNQSILSAHSKACSKLLTYSTAYIKLPKLV